jgi:hypothetical protein
MFRMHKKKRKRNTFSRRVCLQNCNCSVLRLPQVLIVRRNTPQDIEDGIILKKHIDELKKRILQKLTKQLTSAIDMRSEGSKKSKHISANFLWFLANEALMHRKLSASSTTTWTGRASDCLGWHAEVHDAITTSIRYRSRGTIVQDKMWRARTRGQCIVQWAER